MSTVSVTNLKNASSSVNNAVTTSGGDLTNAAGVSYMGGSKNLLYNGAMQVAQRGTSTASITTAGYYTADRWSYGSSGPLGTYTQSLEADAPTGSGLRNSLKMLCTTAKASPAAGDFAAVVQSLEGQDVQRIAKGTASAQQVTLSFWVKANVTGTYIASLEDVNNTRDVSASYTISASATWEKKTITFPADTTGAFTNDNGASLRVRFWLAAGSTFTSGTLNTVWASTTNANRAVGQTNLAAATNNYWQVTGVQLEVGPVATSFEFKSFGQELRECQRYYQKSYAQGTAPGTSTDLGSNATCGVSNQFGDHCMTWRPFVVMRSFPTMTFWSSTGTANVWTYDRSGASGTATPVFSGSWGTDSGGLLYQASGASWAGVWSRGHWVASAEL